MTDNPQKKESELGRLERELYSRTASSELTEREKDLAQLGIRREKLGVAVPKTKSAAWVSLRAAARRRRRRILALVAGLLALGLVVAGGVGATIWYRLRQNVKSEQIALTVAGPSSIVAGEALTYTVNFGNDSFVDWENVEVSLEFPPGLQVTQVADEAAVLGRTVRRQVGRLVSGERGSFTVSGRLIAEENETVVAKAELALTPENFPSGRFTGSAVLATVISGAPIDVALVAAKSAAVGERVAATIAVTNKSGETLEGVYVQLNPAVGMRLAADDPEFSAEYSASDRLWHISSLPSLTTVSRTVILFVEGEAGESRVLDAAVGLARGEERFVQQRTGAVITIASSMLAIEQRYQDKESPLVVAAGERVRGVVKYTNAGTGGLKNVIVRAQIAGESFDLASLKLPAGAYDPATRTITWTSATVPALALLQPQQSGEITFEFSVKPAAQLPAEETSKNSTIAITAFVDSPDVVVPVGEERKPIQDQFVMSVKSDITLAAEAFYDDGRLGLTSSGPTPPKAGEQTTYSVRLRLGSTLNDLGDVQVTAVLPDGVRYTGEHVATAGSLQFEERSGQLVWSVPQVAGLTGRASPSLDLYWQVAVRPGEHQRGTAIDFLNRLTATGLDLFVDEELTYEVTTYPTTESAVPGKGRVE